MDESHFQPFLIVHACIATLGETPALIEDGALLVERGRIADVGTTAEVTTRHPHVERWDAGGQLLMPAAVCAHTHFYGAFARGWASPGDPPKNFPQILERRWWRLDRALTLEDVRYSALVCLLDAIRHGTTTLIDHHASAGAIEGSLDIIAEAVEQAGMRACLGYEVSDRHGREGALAGVAENLRFAQALAADSRRRAQLAFSFGLHASLTLSDETLADCVAAVERLGPDHSGFHIHVAEDRADQDHALHISGKRVVHRLHAAGVLGPRTVAAHCVHVNADEITLLAETGTWVSHQPRSNMHNGVGVAPIETMMEAGVRVCLGNDGFSNDMLAEMKTAYLVHKLNRGDPRALPADRVIHIAYGNNSQLAQVFWPESTLGCIQKGACADFVLYDYRPPTPLTATNLPWHLLYGIDSALLTATVCNGRVLMRDRVLTTLDEEAITCRSRELAAELWHRVE